MKLWLRISTTLLCVALFLLPPVGYGDEASFDRAVNEYLKGFRACSEANTLRLTNITEANKKFTYYQQQLDLAVAIDESILTSNEREMDNNLAYCQRVEDNLKRAEATPILQHAFGYCETARAAFEQGQYPRARQQFEEYRRYQEDAYAITATLDEVFVLSSQVRSCARFEEKLLAKEAEQARYQAMLDEVVTLYQQFKLECESTLAFVNREGFAVKELVKANNMLAAALEIKAQANSQTKAWEYANQQPDSEISLTLNQLTETTRICEGAVAEAIRSMEKQKRQYQQAIAQQNSNLRLSLQSCQTASAAADAGNLDNATHAYETSAKLKKQATGKSLVALVKEFPRWQSSSQYNGLLEKTKQCQTLAASKILALQKSLEEARLAAEQAQQKAATETSAQPPQDNAIIPEPSLTPNQEASQADSTSTPVSEPESPLPQPDVLDDLEDWEEDVSFIEEEAGKSEKEEDKGAGKSWTDLIK